MSTHTLTAFSTSAFAAFALVVLVAAAGCDNKETAVEVDPPGDELADESADNPAKPSVDDEPKEADEAPKAASAAVAEGTPFADYNLEAIAQKWQGSWVLPGSSLGTVVAWNVDGAKVTVFDGEEEKTLDLSIVAPCKMTITEKKDGSSSSTHKTFAVTEAKVFSGLGSAGALTDKGAVVCTGGKVYELDGGECAEWKERFGKWEKTGADCSLEDGTFQAGSKKLESIDGALVDAQMKRNEARPFDNFADAKAALEETKATAK
jgi:hypothetical protein